MLRLRLLLLPLVALALLATGCMGGAQIPPPEAFLSLGRVSGPAEATEETEGEATAEVDVEGSLEKWRQRHRENARKLRSLSWSTRVRYRVAGAYTIHLLYRAAADENGDVRVTELTRRLEMAQGVNRTVDAPPPGDDEFNRAATLAALARLYTFPLPGAMEGLLQSTNLVEASPGGRMTLAQTSFVMPEDRVSLELAPVGLQPEALDFTALVDDTPVEGTTRYRKLPDGMFYPYTVSLTLPDKDTTVLVENFGFRLQPK